MGGLLVLVSRIVHVSWPTDEGGRGHEMETTVQLGSEQLQESSPPLGQKLLPEWVGAANDPFVVSKTASVACLQLCSSQKLHLLRV